MNYNPFLRPPQGAKSPSITAILEAIACFASFAPDTRQAAIRLLEREHGLAPGEFWAIAQLYLESQEVVR